MFSNSDLVFLNKVAQEAAKLALGYKLKGVDSELKADNSFVSEADREVEAFIYKRLSEHFPDWAIIGEEAAKDNVEGKKRFYVDPIDGTTNYLKGLPTWGISIGACDEQDRLLAGSILLPDQGKAFYAAKGLGSFRNGVRLEQPTTGMNGKLLVGLNIWHGGLDDWGGESQVFQSAHRVIDSPHGVRFQGASVADTTALAQGHLDVVWAAGMGKWDSAAGLMILKETGFMITDPNGEEVNTPVSSFLASAPSVHEDFRSLLLG